MSLFSEYNGVKTTLLTQSPQKELSHESIFSLNDPYLGKPVNSTSEKVDAYHKTYKPIRKPTSPLSLFQSFDLNEFYSSNPDTVLLIIITFLSFFTRMYKIGAADTVIWDEAHFGKFGAYYINGTFYHDVHPPLAKMLVGLSEYLAGFNGAFKFESGARFPDHVGYVFMRIFNAFFGAVMAPFAYLTMRNFSCSRRGAFIASLFVIVDNATCTISRFILLDAMLLGFTAMSLYFLSGIYANRNSPFTKNWWINLAMTGVSLGLVSSSKWVGLFAVALVGLYTIDDLYQLLGDRAVSFKEYAFHWIARIACLIVIPVIVYLIAFKIHFALLYKSGSGDSTMPSIFQAGLKGSSLGKQAFDIAYDSRVTFKANSEYGYLHSHPETYPEGSKEKQVTTYSHKDHNNDWLITRPDASYPDADNNPLEYIKDGSVVRLIHAATNSSLSVLSEFKSPVTKKLFEACSHSNVSAIGNKDAYLWKFEVVSDYFGSKTGQVTALSTQFKLKNVKTGCYLRLSGENLPEWAFKQYEVGCGDDSSSSSRSELATWNIESNIHKKLSFDKNRKFKSSFLKDFVHLNKAMFRSNNALTPDIDKIDYLTSSPLDWPIVRKGLRICSYGDTDYKFYLIGNPIIWWLSFAFIVAYPFQILYNLILWKRGIPVSIFSPNTHYIYPATILWLGWLLHYAPFFIMGRVTYLHHYFPAIYFGMLFMAFQVNHFSKKLPSVKYFKDIDILVAVLAVLNFIFFVQFTFGFDYPARELKYRKWLSTWDMN
ncbi:hypothetical protein BB560_005928 [Smittium megazygosporum]|uniref:Dolichyl-phosphate-mannose--protein mannosyltransferase n=1 Tax=Smittium megazygosporum TaxID=133381 RepID=A0A2T9YQH7_9FUNG|nr:hypothetical protein BB560_005928 [Smittium megazygosporum]